MKLGIPNTVIMVERKKLGPQPKIKPTLRRLIIRKVVEEVLKDDVHGELLKGEGCFGGKIFWWERNQPFWNRWSLILLQKAWTFSMVTTDPKDDTERAIMLWGCITFTGVGFCCKPDLAWNYTVQFGEVSRIQIWRMWRPIQDSRGEQFLLVERYKVTIYRISHHYIIPAFGIHPWIRKQPPLNPETATPQSGNSHPWTAKIAQALFIIFHHTVFDNPTKVICLTSLPHCQSILSSNHWGSSRLPSTTSSSS